MGELGNVPDLTLYAAPAFLSALLVERWASARRVARGEALVGYADARDTWTSLAMGVGSIAFITALHVAVFAAAQALYPLRLVTLLEPLSWVAAIVLWDFVYYWHHRFEHEIRLLWAAHVNHHSSRAFNFSTALRQPWTPWIGVLLFPPLALLGVRPEQIIIAEGVNLIYQFWVHTELVTKLPAPLDWLLNTPSHHRVHHGKNPRYIDKNYGGILIVWDRLFGTFERETDPVVYGLTKDIASDNPLVIAFHEYVAIARDVVRAPDLRTAWGVVFGHPR